MLVGELVCIDCGFCKNLTLHRIKSFALVDDLRENQNKKPMKSDTCLYKLSSK